MGIQAQNGQARRMRMALEALQQVQERLHLSEPQAPFEGRSEQPENRISLHHVISLSSQWLDDEAKSMLWSLAVFPAKPNSFSEEAALAVSHLPVTALDALVDAGLVQSCGPDRYTMHQTIADFAATQPRDNTVYQRLVTFFVDYLVTHVTDYALLEQERTNILSALDIAHAQSLNAMFVRGIIAYIPFLHSRGLYGLASSYLQRAYHIASATNDRASIAQCLLHLGASAEQQGNYAQAEAYLREGLAVADEELHADVRGALSAKLAWVVQGQGDYVQAKRLLLEGLSLARKTENTREISNLLNKLGGVFVQMGAFTEADAFFQEGLALTRRMDYRERLGMLLNNFGILAALRGDYIHAQDAWQEGLVLARQEEHQEQICSLLTNLGNVACQRGDREQAVAYYQEGLALARQMEHQELVAGFLLNLGDVACQQEAYEQAERDYQAAFTLVQQIGHCKLMGEALNEWAKLRLKQQRFVEAEAMLREAMNSVPVENQCLVAILQYNLAHALFAQDKGIEARKCGETSLAIFDRIGHVQATEVRDWLASWQFVPSI
jgi:tetratricopeptide (TPR) repeat protein